MSGSLYFCSHCNDVVLEAFDKSKYCPRCNWPIGEQDKLPPERQNPTPVTVKAWMDAAERSWR